MQWGCCAGCGGGGGGGEGVDGGVEGGLRVEGRGLGSRRGKGGEARSVGPWSYESLGRVSWGEEQGGGGGGGGGVPEKCCIANSLIDCARPMLMLRILDLVEVRPLFSQVN